MTEAHIVTRCPSCHTAFRASEAQISAREGQVRCGRCETVFNALEHSRPSDDIHAAQDGDAVPADSPEPNFPIDPAKEPLAAAPEGLPQFMRNSQESAAEAETLILTPAPSDALPHEMEVRSQPAAVASDVADPNLEFDFGPSRRPSRLAQRWLGCGTIGLLLATLAMQLAFHFRGDLSLLFPTIKPYFEALCARAGCSLPLPRRADMMSIESSDLQADPLNPGVMMLSATLRNRAPFSQNLPALELTLTDGQDQPLARRVLPSADYASGASAASVAAGSAGGLIAFPSGSELPVKVYFDASAIQPTGYRLYLFYP